MHSVTQSDNPRGCSFVGRVCATCEEPLEHTLRGEHILQLVCGHLTHEVCFREYMADLDVQGCPHCEAPLALDTNRGSGNINYHELQRLIEAAFRNIASTTESQSSQHQYDRPPTPARPPPSPPQSYHQVRSPSEQPQLYRSERHTPDRTYDSQHVRRLSDPSTLRSPFLSKSSIPSNPFQQERYNITHQREQSTSTTDWTASEFADGPVRYSHDLGSVDNSQSGARYQPAKRRQLVAPTTPPTLTLRSEFPNIHKCRQQQSLTCLVTIEVPEETPSVRSEPARAVHMLPSPVLEEVSEFSFGDRRSAISQRPVDSVHEDDTENLEAVHKDLVARVDNWHDLDDGKFGPLILFDVLRVGKDRQAWQELRCYLFTEMLICIKEKKSTPRASQWDKDGKAVAEPQSTGYYSLKGSILVKKHLVQVDATPDSDVLTLVLSVDDLPFFHLQFSDHTRLVRWQKALNKIQAGQRASYLSTVDTVSIRMVETQCSSVAQQMRGDSGIPRSSNLVRAQRSASCDRCGSHDSLISRAQSDASIAPSLSSSSSLSAFPSHVPLDLVLVVPVSSSMLGLKTDMLHDSLRFIVSSLGEHDRIGLVTFGSNSGAVPIMDMTGKHWTGWTQALELIRPVGASRPLHTDLVDGANVAMDMLMQRKSPNPLAHILLISDASEVISSTDDSGKAAIDFVVSRAEAAKVGIHCFGLGTNHDPDTMVELSNRTRSSYTYVKDWTLLRECLAGCMGALQTISHQNVQVVLRLPEGSSARFVKINGALHVTQRASGRDAEAFLGDLRVGDKRDLLVQLAIPADPSSRDSDPQDPWGNVISTLEALSPLSSSASSPSSNILSRPPRQSSVLEMPLLQADLTWGDVHNAGTLSHLPAPSLLTIAILPTPPPHLPPPTPLPSPKRSSTAPIPTPLLLPTPTIPPHPAIVLRRMELLASDMLTRALHLAARNYPDRAAHLLAETRSILRGLAKGSLPPLPPVPSTPTKHSSPSNIHPSPPTGPIDPITTAALDATLTAAAESITHPLLFARDPRNAALQAIANIAHQRAYATRTPVEKLCAARNPGVVGMLERSRAWKGIEAGGDVE